MADLDQDTRVDGGDGRYTATLAPAWEIWGPCGGYVATVLLRAAGAHSAFPRPTSLMVHFVGVGRFAPVDLETETVRAGRRSESVRVRMTQEGRAVAEALVWTVADHDPAAGGLTYDWTTHPDPPAPEGLAAMDELLPDPGRFAFWRNLECRPTDFLPPERWAVERPLAPTLRQWYRFRPRPAWDDPYVEAGRVTIVADLMGWPTVVRALEPGDEERWIAPNLDLTVTFHQPPADADWLFLDAEAPIATGDLVGAHGHVWAGDGRLLATSVQHMLARPVGR